MNFDVADRYSVISNMVYFLLFITFATYAMGARAQDIEFGWQTYCAVPLEAPANAPRATHIDVTPLGRPSPQIRSGSLFVSDGKLRVSDLANKEQFVLHDGEYLPSPPVKCPDFQAFGWTIVYGGDGKLSACSGHSCATIEVMPRTLAFSIAASNGGIFVGTSQGDTLLFREGEWCRMVLSGETYACPATPAPVVTTPGPQFYSSTVYRSRTLVGQYPSGRIYEFDGERVFPSDMTPPAIISRGKPGFESQTLASYCGNLFVGYWPYGEIFRYDGEKWHEPIRLFSSPPSAEPYKEAAESAGVIFNFFGQRVASLVPYQGALYAITSNKGDWNSAITPTIPTTAQEEYGAVYQLHGKDCETSPSERT
jgi:outer membrane protein assembly factor BamB